MARPKKTETIENTAENNVVENAPEEEVIVIKEIRSKTATIKIVGDGEIICNKMSDPTARAMMDKQNNKAKNATENVNKWEEVITSIRWEKDIPREEYTQEGLGKNLDPSVNRPCISAFGLKKSCARAVRQFGIDKQGTKFEATVNFPCSGGNIPFSFTDYHLDEKLIPSPTISRVPVKALLSRFGGWEATFTIRYVDTIYSLEQICNIINLAGFGLGVGSGKKSGYGRFHIASVT